MANEHGPEPKGDGGAKNREDLTGGNENQHQGNTGDDIRIQHGNVCQANARRCASGVSCRLMRYRQRYQSRWRLTADKNAIIRVLDNACIIWRFSKRETYHLVVNPPHFALLLARVKRQDNQGNNRGIKQDKYKDQIESAVRPLSLS